MFFFPETNTEFSKLPLHQVYEQNNTYIKIVAGSTHLVHRADKGGLNRCELYSNEIDMILQEFEDELYDTEWQSGELQTH